MTSFTDLVFLAGFACLVTHELDAIRQGEWRFFFQFTSLSDEAGYRLFTAIHALAFVFILATIEQAWLQIGLDVFLVIHAGLHILLRDHPLVTFNTAFSWWWILGGAGLGTLHLMW